VLQSAIKQGATQGIWPFRRICKLRPFVLGYSSSLRCHTEMLQTANFVSTSYEPISFQRCVCMYVQPYVHFTKLSTLQFALPFRSLRAALYFLPVLTPCSQ